MIYVIGPQDSFVVKIGHTTNQPSFRLGNLQTGNPERLVVRWAGEGDEALEKHLHAALKGYRIRGEWFDLSPLGDPVEAVKDEIRKANKRLADGEGLLFAERHRSILPRVDLKAFDEVPVDPVRFHETSRVARFPRPTGDIVMPTDWNEQGQANGHDPKPGCIRGWRGRCLRPSNTTCNC